jgi:hypothetical protein
VTENANSIFKNIVAQYQVERWEDKKEMETILPPKNNLIQDSEGNEKNRYPVADSNKTNINNAKEPSVATKSSKKKSCK